jgi:serine/threonine protein kinase
VVAGQVIAGRFVLQAHAATGGMGTVYRARDLVKQRPVAVKIVTLGRPYDLERFDREAEMLASVEHPNVVGYIAHGDSDGVHFLAQEWVDGSTLAAYLRGTGATVREAVDLATGVASAVAAIHKAGVIHRDIKPSNVILVDGRPDRVKLVDFGIARLAKDAKVLTRTGIVVGTPSYMAPEQARGESHITVAADVWSLGCLLYEALSGRVPFAGKSATAVRAKVVLAEPPRVDGWCPEAPAALVDLVHAALAKDPALRPADGAAIVDRLLALGSLPDGPRRKVGSPEPTTKRVGVTTTREQEAEELQSYLLISLAEPEPETAPTDRSVQLDDVAARHGMGVHVLDEGTAMLVAEQSGKRGAIAAARAAAELRAEVFDGAIAVFARPVGEDIDNAVERGAELLDQAVMQAVFSDEHVVALDDIISELVAEEVPGLKT